MRKKKIMFRAFKTDRVYFAAVFAVLVLLCAALMLFRTGKYGNAAETFAIPLSGKVIIIDPGHGGMDSGAVANGAVEKEINLKISQVLQKYIEEGGGCAILTRTEDTDTANPDRGNGISRKTSDLKERKQDIADYKADMFVSVHMNKFQQPQYKGAQVFYTSESGESKRLGETLQQALKDVLNDGNTRLAKPSGDKIFVLKNNTVPSALVECGFLSNPQEAEQLMNDDYRRKIAWGIYVGIARFFATGK